MGWTSLLGAGFALAGTALALAFLPDRVNQPVEAPIPAEAHPVAPAVAPEIARAA
jgi:hypothetical protein